MRAIPIESAIIDGEVAVHDATGIPRLAALQEALSFDRGPFVLYVFDLLYLNGRDLRALPLIERKALLAPIVAGGDVVKHSEHFEDGDALFRLACTIGAEGAVSKRRDAPYPSGRVRTWVKAKCTLRQEFVIAGYVRSKISVKAIGSLVLGYYQDGHLIYAGRVGTGFSEEVAVNLFLRLQTLRIPVSPFAKKLSSLDRRDVNFARPELVAEVEFRAWTRDRILRHATFLSLREDKRAEDVSLEALG